jgi:hypothetical protein
MSAPIEHYDLYYCGLVEYVKGGFAVEFGISLSKMLGMQGCFPVRRVSENKYRVMLAKARLLEEFEDSNVCVQYESVFDLHYAEIIKTEYIISGRLDEIKEILNEL